MHINPKPQIIRHLLKDDGVFPNSPLFLLIYKTAFDPEMKDAENIIRNTFEKNDWSNCWKDGIYDYAHYHSITHEVLGVFSGTASVQFGGGRGVTERLSAGDVVIIPAGVAHQCIIGEDKFKCVGAYPGGMDYDIKKGLKGERPEADENIARVPIPDTDPVYGAGSYLTLEWAIQG
jgi:uncharacterized protein YjlB